MPDKKNRIKGTVLYFNGALGRVKDDAGTEYKLHLNQILPQYKEAARRELRGNCIIEFTPLETNNMPRAMDVTVVDMPPLPEPTGLSVGYWETVRGCRCSACGKPSSEEHLWCPVCGAKMYSRDVYDIILETTAKIPAADSIDVKKSDCGQDAWAALCSMFRLDPGTSDRISISHAIVRT